MSSKRCWWLVIGASSMAALISWAGVVSLPSLQVSPPASEHRRAAAEKAEPPPAPVSTLHEQASSAYHARLFVDDDGVILITQTGFTALRAGRAAEEHRVSLGPVAVRDGGDVVFWRAGQLRAMSISGDGERELAAVTRAPQHLLASEGRLAWFHAEQTGASLHTLSGGTVRFVYASEDSTSASVMRGATVYWVSLARERSWAIGRVGLDGRQPPRFTRARQGRPPAMLAVGRDGVYFYDGPERGVRRLSFDLERETAVSTRSICSPLAVSSRVVCAHVGGVFDIPPSARAPRPLAAERSGPITAIAATDDRAYWVADNEGKLIVRSIALPGP